MSATSLQGIWNVYWSQHGELLLWHAATAKRRQVSEQLSAAPTDLRDVDPTFIDIEHPCDTSVLSVAAAENQAEGERPDIELLFCAVARLGPIAYCSFAPEVDASGKRAAIFRAQMGTAMAAATVGRDLSAFVGFSLGPTRLTLNRAQLVLRGGFLLKLVDEVSHESFKALFDVFGPCIVEFPREKRDRTPEGPSPCILVTYTEDNHLSVLDASAALRSLQVWLAFDWGLLLTYSPLPTDLVESRPLNAEQPANNDEDDDDDDGPPACDNHAKLPLIKRFERQGLLGISV